MLTIAKIKNGAGYKQHISNNDYYEEGQRVEGQWIGHGAEKLGLTGKVDLDHFKAVGEGRDPKTREPLRQRKNVDRLRSREVNGKQIVEEYKAVNFYDCTISAPKDISILAMIDPRAAQWHREAALETVRRIESGALAAVRKGGVCESRLTSNLVIAAYHHDTSRALDKNLHTHMAVANLTYDGAEGIWKALSAYQIFEQVDLYTEIYRNELAAKVMGGGYRIEDHVKDGKDNGFGIVGISEATREKFSRRSAQRDAAIADFRATHGGREPTKNEVRRLVRETREDKLTSITTDEVKAQQWARLDPDEVQTLQDLHQAALERGTIREHAPAGPSLSYAAEHIFERVSVAKDHELKAEALRHGRDASIWTN
jgi:conjugative relaxase-like TrwC/TraI family protein